MSIDSDLSNMIFFASIACILMGQYEWAMYLVMAALYMSMIEHGINPIHVNFNKAKIKVEEN